MIKRNRITNMSGSYRTGIIGMIGIMNDLENQSVHCSFFRRTELSRLVERW